MYEQQLTCDKMDKAWQYTIKWKNQVKEYYVIYSVL